MRKRVRRLRQTIVERSPPWLVSALGPTVNYLDMLFVDHGIFRLIYLNRHRLSTEAWRAAQPAPHQIRAIANSGVRTIVNLRGERICGSYSLERQACQKHGIELVNFQVRSRAAPSKEELHGARDLFERIQYPMLLHCKSGADRAGLMSVLYCHLQLGMPIAEAKEQLSLRYGHIRQAETGILDYFLERYVAYNEVTPMPFFEWVDTVYDPEEVKESFQSGSFANILVNKLLRRE